MARARNGKRELSFGWVRDGADDSERLLQKVGSFGAHTEKCCAILREGEVGAVTFYTFEIVVEKEADNTGYLAYSPTLPGCFSNGKTIEAAKRNIREAIQQHVQSLLAHQQPVPQNEKLVHVEELTVAVP